MYTYGSRCSLAQKLAQIHIWLILLSCKMKRFLLIQTSLLMFLPNLYRKYLTLQTYMVNRSLHYFTKSFLSTAKKYWRKETVLLWLRSNKIMFIFSVQIHRNRLLQCISLILKKKMNECLTLFILVHTIEWFYYTVQCDSKHWMV